MLLSLGIVWLACAAVFLELAERAPVMDEEGRYSPPAETKAERPHEALSRWVDP